MAGVINQIWKILSLFTWIGPTGGITNELGHIGHIHCLPLLKNGKFLFPRPVNLLHLTFCPEGKITEMM